MEQLVPTSRSFLTLARTKEGGKMNFRVTATSAVEGVSTTMFSNRQGEGGPMMEVQSLRSSVFVIRILSLRCVFSDTEKIREIYRFVVGSIGTQLGKVVASSGSRSEKLFSRGRRFLIREDR